MTSLFSLVFSLLLVVGVTVSSDTGKDEDELSKLSDKAPSDTYGLNYASKLCERI